MVSHLWIIASTVVQMDRWVSSVTGMVIKLTLPWLSSSSRTEGSAKKSVHGFLPQTRRSLRRTCPQRETILAHVKLDSHTSRFLTVHKLSRCSVHLVKQIAKQ